MKSAWLLTVIIASVCREANSFQWTSNIPNKTYACENQSLILQWSFSVEPKEKLEDIKWDHDFLNGTRENIANYVNGHFAIVSDSFVGRLNYMPTGGIELTSTKVEDSGTFRSDFGWDTSSSPGGDPVFDPQTNELALRLSCGELSIPANLPVAVEWTNASVTVDEVRARLTVVEVKQRILQQENTDLKETVKLLTDENKSLNNSEKALQNELNRAKDYLEELDSKKVRFDVRLAGNPYYITGQRIRFDQVITNENNAYDVDSGIFTAPFNGTYFFVVTGAQYSDRVGGLVLGDDDTTFCRLQLPITSSISVSCQSTVYLYKGQQVSVKSEGQVYLSSPFSSFVGFSLDPDMRLDCLMIIIPLLCPEITSFQWTSDLQDGADVYACIGDSVTLPWGYTAQDGETVEDIKGNYFVTATVLRGSTFAVYNSTVSLRLSENVQVHQSEALWARQERLTVHDNNTGQLHAQLSCGGYVITGHPPLSVEWTFPSGKTQLVSTHINGTFVLSVPNPIQGGEQEMIRTEKQVLQAEVDRLREENRRFSEATSSQQKYLQGMQ
ncbi:hypothetical protein C0Q70_21064 [Pomacea canaliculata]|uniref:C1q domain-containing protein n=1 Tax=Pomacea canaliculata TaxID=400727 RepID=A0A2T7NBI0_POMCA|nr:hypothetical protein C0Q70_21064 [Pomacea canaliculata]